MEPNRNLGTKPVSGPADHNGVWKGVVGNVFGGDYHYSAGVYNARKVKKKSAIFIPFITT